LYISHARSFFQKWFCGWSSLYNIYRL